VEAEIRSANDVYWLHRSCDDNVEHMHGRHDECIFIRLETNSIDIAEQREILNIESSSRN
jgi:hypothetical protein